MDLFDLMARLNKFGHTALCFTYQSINIKF